MPPTTRELDKLPEVASINLAALLSVINSRIEALLGRDHLVGHSYFLKVTSDDDLKTAMCRKILPLLREYFYGDYGKIGLILGRGFVRIKNNASRRNIEFAQFEYDSEVLVESTVYELIPENEIDIRVAISQLQATKIQAA